MRARVSIAMCTYNGETYLQQQLDSIRTQTLLPDELIICDDGSSDATLSIAGKFARTAPFQTILVRNETNLGYNRNFAQAVQRCSHELVALCDQDDIWHPHKLAHLEWRMRSDPELGGVFSDGRLIDSASRPTGRTLWQSFRFDSEEQATFANGGAVDVLLRRNVVTGMTIIFRRSLGYLLEQRPPHWIHDGWLAFLIATRSRLLACPEQLVDYRIHGNQQVGAPLSVKDRVSLIRRNGLNAYLKNVRERNLREYERTAAQFDELAEFLRRQAERLDNAVIAKVEAKIAHARRGAALLSSGRTRRWSSLGACPNGYEQYSPTGLRAYVRDLLI
jgi:glycosyltransferase involved in cell wall biosynthesis